MPGTPVDITPNQILTDDGFNHGPFGFRPDRWLEDGARLEKSFVAFSGGTRLSRKWGCAAARDGAEGDVRTEDVGTIKIYETSVCDCEMAADCFIPIPYKGLR
ncbi:uncharacterized protein BCR38DRAFT_483016 [Pseudomassariella vexata]|uniref:Uncharacterized protein n=1 Tax=Pseudomassariella vexata TaxID=1141098 RepID=A0A1Y2E754_9PEZI|nr:uncharacterized protein BCR38DRAFT_483016 [Pseudomassariella vexata]ORY67398.1 hypothetical protein BCR38DRAFT_483016 [Pseudomassariella vexata]